MAAIQLLKSIFLNIFPLLAILILSSGNIYAQDKIVKIDGEIVNAKILEIDIETIKFKKSNYLDGPLYTLKKSQIRRIVLENGNTEEYNSSTANENNLNNLNDDVSVYIPERNCVISLFPFLKYEIHFTVEFLEPNNSVLFSQADYFSFYFQEEKGNFTMYASKKDTTTFYATFRLNSPGAKKRLQRLRDCQIRIIGIMTKSGYYQIPIDKVVSDKINKMVYYLIPADRY